jgi:hypothetical protein
MFRIISISLCLLFSSCVGASDSGPTSPAPGATEPVPTAVVSDSTELSAQAKEQKLDPRVLSGLAAADAKDGAVDQVVTKCSGCSLMMNGKKEHSLQVGDYVLQLCSGACKEYFAKDLEGNLEQLVALVEPAKVENSTAD